MPSPYLLALGGSLACFGIGLYALGVQHEIRYRMRQRRRGR